MEHEPLHKMFNHNTPARIDLFPQDNEEPLRKSYAGSFDALCDDLAVIRDQREQQQRRDAARRQQAQQQQADRQRAEAERNRRLSARKATRLVKSVQDFIRDTPAKIAAMAKSRPPSTSALDQAMADLTALHQRVNARRTEDVVRDRLRDLYASARAGELAPLDVCRLDSLRCRAVEMGLRP